MQYQAVGNRCAIDLSTLSIPIDVSRRLLSQLQFTLCEVDVVTHLRTCIKASRYSRGVSITEAPGVVDCSSLIKWVFAQKGIRVPRLSIQQSVHGEEVPYPDMRRGDVLCTSGCVNFYDTDPNVRIGHVGLYTGEGTVIHAASARAGVVEVSTKKFLGRRTLHRIRRFSTENTITVEFKEPLMVESSDDIKWMLLRSLPTLDRSP